MTPMLTLGMQQTGIDVLFLRMDIVLRTKKGVHWKCLAVFPRQFDILCYNYNNARRISKTSYIFL
jgi:hypothetical protein